MARYFMEVAYKGTAYSGFQIQENAETVQSVVEKAFQTLHRKPIQLTGSSRTDAGVHALQNFFHFDFEEPVHPQSVYKLNAILPRDIAVKNIFEVHRDAHSRFDATGRAYAYRIHQFKNPFLEEASYYYPYQVDTGALTEGAAYIKSQTDFFSFSKSNTQVRNFQCHILVSNWEVDGQNLTYRIEGNRFLRGMVRLLTGALLKLGRRQTSFQQFRNLFSPERKAGLSVPAHGLYLIHVAYPPHHPSSPFPHSPNFPNNFSEGFGW